MFSDCERSDPSGSFSGPLSRVLSTDCTLRSEPFHNISYGEGLTVNQKHDIVCVNVCFYLQLFTLIMNRIKHQA